ncbi:hypothetical protein GCM10029978_066850 [Actinoallomurus acanthiterrae]
MRVHFNLHKRLWSVTALTGSLKRRVVAHVGDITLIDVQFTVSAAGRARSIRLGSRMVHAWAIGTVIEVDTNPDLSELIKVTYSPRAGRPATFVMVSRVRSGPTYGLGF